MCDHENREAAMPVIAPGVWCDPCLVPLVKALNDNGLPTVASCCGHNHSPGNVMLADGRELLVIPDPEWGSLLSDFIHAQVGCKPGRECSSCASLAEALTPLTSPKPWIMARIDRAARDWDEQPAWTKPPIPSPYFASGGES